MAKGTVDPATLQKWLADGSAILLDVREPAEHQAVRIPGARLMPLATVAATDLPQSGKVVVHCLKGGRGETACQRLLQQRPELEVFNLEGGIESWSRAGLPVQRGS